MWKRSVSKLLYSHRVKPYGLSPYNTVLRRSVNTNANEWIWLRTQYGYFSVANRSGTIRRAEFSGGTPWTRWLEIQNNDGSCSYKVFNGEYRNRYLAVSDGRLYVDKDENNKANLLYDSNDLSFTNQSDGSHLYYNKGSGYFYFGGNELEKHHKYNIIGAVGTTYQQEGNMRDGYEKCVISKEFEIQEHSPGLI